MKMTELIRYDVPAAVVALWREQEGEALLPLQELAVKRHGLFGEENLLIQAPTSSGKTFIGEMAAIQTALRRRKVVYLAPLKALAEEKYRDFQEKYAHYGVKVIVSSRDRREYDRDFEAGDYSIAVVVYEKLAQLLVRRPERLSEIHLVIADELELLSDPERGAMAELLLARVLRAGRRLIGLSAVLGGAERLAAWMNARLLAHERRPVELRFGVLHEGVFRYRGYNEGVEGEEAMEDAPGETAWEILTRNVARLAAQGESTLIFVKAKHESRRGAELLADRLRLPAADEAIAALRRREPTRSRDALIETLGAGVAFHNADMSPEERGIVEHAFRAGAIKVMVSTSTLAAGMNLPARNVFLSAEKWRYDQRLGIPWKTPLLRAEYENMSGRAGRYGAGHAFGRSVLIAATPFDQETLWRRYVEGEREPVEPRLAEDPLENHVLRLAASRCCRTSEELLDFLENTLSGRWVWAENYPLDEIAFKIRGAVNRCADAGVIHINPEGGLEATPFGMAAAAKGVSIAAARELAHWIGESETRDWIDLDLLFAAAAAPDARLVQVSLSAREYERADYPGLFKRITRDEPIAADVPMNRIRNCTLQPFFDEVRAIKIALFLNEWNAQMPVREIEERYHTMLGQILAAADQISWIIDAAAAIAAALGADAAFTERIRSLAERTQRGLLEEMLPVARAGARGLDRNALLRLHAHGLYDAAAIAAAPQAVLAQWMPAETARALRMWARQTQAAAAPEPPETTPSLRMPALIVDDAAPGELLVDGARAPLQEKQYRMIRVLAANPGICVPYARIYQAVWGESVVEDSQIHFQKRKLIAAIAAASPSRDRLIKTVPKRGFILDISPEDVLVKSLSMAHPG